ncbi:MAG: 16S rRNA (uracil(1498)-N(3))-methyltransferase [Firmicutes bacterium]|nr:16S rRNA (uracil(1498)-N(3))-methyltransferase [[Eubacterium] siraeum]MCM1489146.1 16S rRNA (uracil(1498)-N(3))-methyltransferase [Bacillota bacterium]
MEFTEGIEKTAAEEKSDRWRYPRFFAAVGSEEVVISGEDAKHISAVLRMRKGDLAVVCDNGENDFLCRIVDLEKDRVKLETLERRKNEAEPSVNITLFQCLPKGDKMDFIVQKATELGAAMVVPTLSKRCVSRPDPKSSAKKIQRWQKIAEEAAKQSGRGKIPQILPLTDFATAAREYGKNGLGILFYECGGESLNGLIPPDAKEIGIFVGSEGGFEPEEAELALSCGIASATLGKRILRCETAPVAALALLMNLTGNM